MRISSAAPTNPILQNTILIPHHLLLENHLLLGPSAMSGASGGNSSPVNGEPDKGTRIDLHA